jgi:hypothetical protein
MEKAKAKSGTRKPTRLSKNGSSGKKEVSELGRILRRLADEHVASGAKLMNLQELRREVRDRRIG